MVPDYSASGELSPSITKPQYLACIEALTGFFELLAHVGDNPPSMAVVALLSDALHNVPPVLLRERCYHFDSVARDLRRFRGKLTREAVLLFDAAASPMLVFQARDVRSSGGVMRALAAGLARLRSGTKRERFPEIILPPQDCLRRHLRSLADVITLLRNQWIGDATGSLWKFGETRLMSPSAPLLAELAVWADLGRVMTPIPAALLSWPDFDEAIFLQEMRSFEECRYPLIAWCTRSYVERVS